MPKAYMRIFRISFPLQMLIGTILGILAGLFFGDLCKVFAPWANAYIMIMKITAIPYLICAIMHGIGQLSDDQGKEILKKGSIFVGFAWAINIAMIYLIAFIFPQAKDKNPTGFITKETPQINFAELLIPENIFSALSNNILPAVVVFSLLIGISLMHVKNKQVIMQGLENIVDSLTRITQWLSRITPIGTFLIIANQIGTIHLATIKQVSTYIILYIIGICILIFWIIPKLISMFTSIRSYQWLQQMFPILLLAYTTNVVIVCLPYIIQLIQKEMQLLYPKDEKIQTQIQGTVSIIFNLPLGSLFIAVFILFLAIFYNTPLSIPSQFELFLTTFLAGLGAVGLGSWINTLTFLLDSLGLPLDSLNLYLITLPFTAGFQSMLSAMEIASLSLLITLATRHLIKLDWSKILRKSVIALIPVLFLVIGIKLFNPLPKIHNEAATIFDCNILSNVETKVHESPTSLTSSGEVFDQILERGTLRVGFNPHVPPFCFYNNDNYLVGYDIAFALELAKDLNVTLELVPMEYGKIVEELNANLYDLAMSAVSITESRLKEIYFSKPYLDNKIVFVTKDKRRREFSSLDNVTPKTKIATLRSSSFETLARDLFPLNDIVPLDAYDSFPASKADILIWEEQEAISWCLRNPFYQVVYPKPSLGTDSLGYAMKAKNPRLLNFMNQWLKLKDNEGFREKQYNLWILGQTEINQPQEPRWSIIRNVFHWVD